MSQRRLEQILSGGPDLADLMAALAAGQLGQTFEPRQYQPTFTLATVLDMRALGLPPVSIGGSLRGMAGALSSITGTSAFFRIGGTFATPVPSAGLTVGTSNAQVRLIPKPGYTIRYAQYNPKTAGQTGTTYNLSQSLAVYVTGGGKFWEVWTAMANDSSGVITSTAALIIAALKANATIASIFQTIDGGSGNGSSVAVESADATAAHPTFGASVAVGASNPPMASEGRVVSSVDGNLILLPVGASQVDLQYRPNPTYSLQNFYGATN